MAYQTLYRKWRPKNFDEVVGQGHITSTLKNEIINNKTAHAYVFTGTRGTGKTSTAKILSRALNCENHQNGNPCNQCPTCKGIINETILDVVEMDAASNTGVENIREIIDQVRYSTASTKYKVYIIDEVHMLSIGAFNALLKTLEEPPSHIVFILATTEIHKIPATILSRCQRFDFKNISASDIADAVGSILEKEGVAITKEAIEYIAYLGNGSMRDALSITEQCLAYKETDITYEDVTDILGTLDDDFLYNAAEYIALGDIRSLLTHFNESVKKGKNPSSFAEGMLKALRDIMLYKMAPEICDFTSKKRELADRIAPLFSKEKLVRCVDIISSALRDIKLTLNSSVLVESMFIRLASPEYEYDINSLLDRISVLEQKIENLSKGMMTEPKIKKSIPEDKKTENQIKDLESKIPLKKKEEVVVSENNNSASLHLADVISGWNRIIKTLEEEGKLITFVSLYGVKPRIEENTIILPFETKDAASKFTNSNAVTDVKEAVNSIFGINPDVKCIFEEKNMEVLTENDDIFEKIAEISTNLPENFKID